MKYTTFHVMFFISLMLSSCARLSDVELIVYSCDYEWR